MAKEKRWWVWLLAAALLVFAALALFNFFASWPIEGTTLALDWKGIWNDLQGGRPHFNTDSLLIVPWDAVLLLPLGWLSFRGSWAAITLLTIAVLVVSVPVSQGRWRLLLALLLLVTAYPALRHIADGNLEWMVIPGFLLTVYGYEKNKIWPLAAGLLLATAKVQEAWVPCLVLGIYLLRTWPAKRLVALFGLIAVFVVPALVWLGREWVFGLTHVTERGSIMDSSLISTLARLSWPNWLAMSGWLILAAIVALYAWRSGPTLSRQKAAVLVAASLLLSPYAAGNSYLTVLTIGIIPLVMTGNPLAIVLLVLVDLPYFASRELLYFWSATYWTGLLLLWIAIAASQARTLPQAKPSAVAMATPET
jgi:Glycosyltransferase family 87